MNIDDWTLIVRLLETKSAKTADWAFVVSLCSAAIALFSLGWNIWSKFIYPKPTVLVRFSPRIALNGEGEELQLSATNMGPTPITLDKAGVRMRGGQHYGILTPKHGDLPKKVEVGETFSVYFIPDHEMLARDDYDRIGFDDTFRRSHWAPKGDVIEARRFIRKACDKVGKSYK